METRDVVRFEGVLATGLLALVALATGCGDDGAGGGAAANLERMQDGGQSGPDGGSQTDHEGRQSPSEDPSATLGDAAVEDAAQDASKPAESTREPDPRDAACAAFALAVTGDSCEGLSCSDVFCQACSRSITACTADGCVVSGDCEAICAAESTFEVIECTDVYQVLGPKELGRPCAGDSQCKSERCSNPPDSSGVCTAGAPDDPCHGGEDCETGICTAGRCRRWPVAITKHYGTDGYERLVSLVVDSSDNLILHGTFSPGLDFGKGALSEEGLGLAKLTRHGEEIWAKSFDGAFGVRMAIDSQDNVYAAGGLDGSPDFGGGQVAPLIPFDGKGSTAIYVVKFDAAGDHVWSTSFDSQSDYIGVRSMAVDGQGRAVIAGYFKGAIDLGAGTFTNTAEGYDIFLLRLNADGSVDRAAHYPGPMSENAVKIVIDDQDAIVMLGEHRGGIDFGGGALTTPRGNKTSFVSKWSTDLVHLYSFNVLAAGESVRVSELALANDGDPMIAGTFGGTLQLGDQPQATDTRELFVARLDADTGAAKYVTHIPVKGSLDVLAVSDTDEAVLGAKFGGDFVLYHLDAAGRVRRTSPIASQARLTNRSYNWGFDGAWTGANTLVFAGHFNGLLTVDGVEYPALGSWDISLLVLGDPDSD